MKSYLSKSIFSLSFFLSLSLSPSLSPSLSTLLSLPLSHSADSRIFETTDCYDPLTKEDKAIFQETNVPEDYVYEMLSLKNPDGSFFFQNRSEIIFSYMLDISLEDVKKRLSHKDYGGIPLFKSSCLIMSYEQQIPEEYVSSFRSLNQTSLIYDGCDIVEAFEIGLDISYASQILVYTELTCSDLSGSYINEMYQKGISFEYVSDIIATHKYRKWPISLKGIIDSYERRRSPEEKVEEFSISLNELISNKEESFDKSYSPDDLREVLRYSFDPKAAQRFLGSGCSPDSIERIILHYDEYDPESIRRYAQLLNFMDIFDDKDTKKPNALMILPRDDYTGIFYHRFMGDFYYDIALHYDTRIRIVSSIDQIPKKMRESLESLGGSIDLLILGAHGTKEGMYFSDNEEGFFSSANIVLMDKIDDYLDDKSRIFLLSCETGKGKSSFAEIFQERSSNARVLASRIRFNSFNIYVNDWFPLDIMIKKGFEDNSF